MNKRLIQLLLLTTSTAMLLFILGFLLSKIGLSWLTGLFFVLASKILLLSFLAFLGLGLLWLLIATVKPFLAYFNRDARALRQWLFLQHRQQDSAQRQSERQRQLRYFQQFRRQRLAARNDRKHLQALFKSINRELQTQKAQTPATTYKQLQKSLQQSLKQADVEAMLAIRQQFHVAD